MREKYTYSIIGFVSIIIFLFASCAGTEDSETQVQSTGQPMLFNDTKSTGIPATQPYVVRSRFVMVNLLLLIDEKGQPRNLDAGTEIALNLFPDTAYIGVIERIEQSAPDSYSWIGHLKDVKFSEMFIVLSGGVFIAHVASPAAVYEVQFAGDDLYQIIEIDQSKFPQD
jgi:hypothetical protein